jgi:hypothetical protein
VNFTALWMHPERGNGTIIGSAVRGYPGTQRLAARGQRLAKRKKPRRGPTGQLSFEPTALHERGVLCLIANPLGCHPGSHCYGRAALIRINRSASPVQPPKLAFIKNCDILARSGRGRCQVTSVIDSIEWVPIIAVGLALVLSAALLSWVVKQDELRTPWVRDVTVTVLIALLLALAGAVWVEYQVPGMWPPWFGPPEQ